MPLGTTIFTKSLDRIITIASGHSLFSGSPLWNGGPRVLRGYTRFDDADNLESFVTGLVAESQGFFSAWLKEATLASGEVYPVRVVGELLIPVPKDVSTDLNECWDNIISFASALSDPAQYQAGESWPSRINFRLHNIDATRNRGIAIFDFGNYGAGGIEFPDP